MATTTRITMPDIEEVNKVVAFTERVKKRKQEYLKAKPHICPGRSRLATESWKETEGQSIVIRRAKLFKKAMEGIPIVIREGELVVGSQTKYVRGASPFVDFNPGAMLTQVESASPTMTSEYVGAEISEEERKSILEDIQYWKGKSVADRIREAREQVFGTIMEDIIEAKLLTRLEASPPQGRDANYEKVLKKGLRGIIDEARDELGKLSHWDREEVQKLHFLQAVIIALEGLIAFARRHSQLAREMAEREKDAVRKKELERIAEVCQWVPENPARNFREAVQSFWF
ncbi:MAG: glycyl radical protein, partial [Chloroflexi bacterium]|nr:glycyl radical protein [Chloroflexota bacterium]